MSDKIRFERLQLVCRKALELSIKKSLSLDQIKTCYPSIAASEDGLRSLEIARLQIVDFWFENSLKEFKLIFDERGIEAKLNELDDLIVEAQQRQALSDAERTAADAPVHLPELTPDQIMEANVLQAKRSTLNSLELIRHQLRLDNDDLTDQLAHATRDGQRQKADLENQVRFFTEGVTKLGPENAAVMRKFDELIDQE